MKPSRLWSSLLSFVALMAIIPMVAIAAPDALGDHSPRPRGSTVVTLGSNAELPVGGRADAVIALGGDVNTAGDVRDAAVALAGNVRATGLVGDAVVAIVGDVYLNSTAKTVVAVLGDVELGPDARVSSEVVTIGGTIKRDPAAVISGTTQSVLLGGFPHPDGLRSWIRHCGLLARPLALDRDLYWAWGLALGFLALYALLTLSFREPLQRCVETLERHPGRAVLAGLLSLVLVPVLVLFLVVTVVGILVVPFLGIAVMGAMLFGKAVMLVWIGRRVHRSAPPLVALLIGGLIVLALYLIPVVGLVVYKLLGGIGLGVVAYTFLLSLRVEKPVRPAVMTEAAAPAAIPADDTLLPRAGFWSRMAALFIDMVLISMALHLVADPGAGAFFGVLVIYAAVMWKLRGVTIGGSIVGLKLVRTDGKPIDWATAIVRALGCLLSMAIGGLGFLWIAFDKERQAWHDRIAGTAVVKVPRGIPLI